MAQVHRTGFTRLSENRDRDGQHRVNIVFVHGLRGHPQQTWSCDLRGRTEDAPPEPQSTTKKNRFKVLFRGKQPTSPTVENNPGSSTPTQIFWLAQLLDDDIPEARLWTYGYNADVVEGVFQANNRNSISQHGRDLSVKLGRALDNEDPIVFVAHSLGGIVVKDAIHRSVDWQGRVRLTVFLGTPHRGSSYADWGKIATRLAAVALQGSNRTVLSALEVDSEILNRIHESFVEDAHTLGMKIHSFQEGRGVSGIAGLDGKVVHDFSSKLDLPRTLETVETIDADHRQMAKCASRDDVQYRDISGVLRQCVNWDQPQGTPSQLATSSSHFSVPFARNKRFVGRTSTLDRIQNFLSDGGAHVALVGLGGVGKTQVALQVAYWAKETRPDWSVFWLPALSMAAFEQACGDLARAVGIESDKEDPKDLVRQYLSSAKSGKWLLTIDNADSRAILFGENGVEGIYDYLPQTDNGRVLLTTRVEQVAVETGDEVVELREMSEAEAVDAFNKLVPQNVVRDDATVGDLLRELAYLPLAISQAAAYVKTNRATVSVGKYLSLLRATEAEAVSLMSREFEDMTRYKGSGHAVLSTWLVSFEQIRQTSERASDLLCFLSHMDPRAIPLGMLPKMGLEEELLNAVGTLAGYAFLERREDSEMFDMHRLVHLATRVWTRKQGREEETRGFAVAHLAETFPSDEWENREHWRVHMPHVSKALWAVSSGEWMEAECKLAYWAGRCLQSDGRIKEAVKLLQHVVTVHKRTLAEDHPDRLASQHELAGAYRVNGQVQAAVKLLQHVVTMRERTLSEDHPDRLASQHTLAGAYEANGQVKQAVKLLKYVVTVWERTLAEEHPSRLASQHELAGVYQVNGQVKEAVELLQHVVTMRERTLAEDHPDRLTSQHELAGAYRVNGQVQAAVGLLQHVVTMRERTLSEDHPDRLASQHALAGVYRVNGQVEEAVKLLKYVVTVRERTLAEEHPSRLASQHALAGAYRANGQFKEAVELLRHVFAIKRRTMSPSHPSRIASEKLLIQVQDEVCP